MVIQEEIILCKVELLFLGSMPVELKLGRILVNGFQNVDVRILAHMFELLSFCLPVKVRYIAVIEAQILVDSVKISVFHLANIGL